MTIIIAIEYQMFLSLLLEELKMNVNAKKLMINEVFNAYDEKCVLNKFNIVNLRTIFQIF